MSAADTARRETLGQPVKSAADQKLRVTGNCHIETEDGSLFARAYTPQDAEAIVARWNALRLFPVSDAAQVGNTAFPALVRLHNTISELTRERDELREKQTPKPSVADALTNGWTEQ